MVKVVNIQNAGSAGWINMLLETAIKERTSDIHIEPERGEMRIRFRIDGIMHVIQTAPVESLDVIISRIKIMCDLDVTEKRLPQDGHFEYEFGGRVYDVRVSVFPSIYGEVAVMRVLNREDILVNLGDLGFEPEQLNAVKSLLTLPYGMILITGPSGAGKTTLLYSMLSSLNVQERNVITLEDPIEFQIPFIRQTQIHDGIGFTFSRALRSVLRQDPNIIMVGEIRDAETAEITINAALSGHLIFSTFHTLNVPGAISRFTEMGIPRSIIATAISGLIASRLARKICSYCAIPDTIPAHIAHSLDIPDDMRGSVKRGRGCEKCRTSGYLGRIGIFEVIPFDQEMKAMIIDQVRAADLFELVRKKTIFTLREAGLKKVFEGLTTIDEVLRVT